MYLVMWQSDLNVWVAITDSHYNRNSYFIGYISKSCRTSAWSCHTAYEYKTAVAKMEKMENDESTTGRMGGM